LKILVVSQYFWPETFIINDLVRALARQGHELVVATGKPNYPEGYVYEGYRSAGVVREEFVEGVELLRIPLRPRKTGGGLNLICNYLSFVFSGVLRLPWLLRGRHFDAILVFAPSPITAALPAILLKYLKRGYLAIWVQDLWPESLAATGFVKGPVLLGAVGRLVQWIYACSDMLLLQSEAFRAPVAQYASKTKAVYYPNPVDPIFFRDDMVASLPVALDSLMQSYFCVVFAGNLGNAQSLDSIVDAAKLLADKKRIRLLLVGTGSRLEWLQQQVAIHALDNVVLAGRFPSEVMPALFRRADALLVSLAPDEIFSKTVPSKIQSYLAAGRPIIAALNGEGARVVRQAGAGLTCPAGDSRALADAICEMFELSPDQRQIMGEAGRAFAREHFEIDQLASRLVTLLRQEIDSSHKAGKQ
jgi:glycosyltransferase involved in cell wall biosynthesis